MPGIDLRMVSVLELVLILSPNSQLPAVHSLQSLISMTAFALSVPRYCW